MAHFVKIVNNIVTDATVVNNTDVADSDFPASEALGQNYLRTLGMFGTWLQTSYNGKFRKNYAGIGWTYHAVLDAFIPPSPYPSWVLDNTTCQWHAPVPIPDEHKKYQWNESSKTWQEYDIAQPSVSPENSTIEIPNQLPPLPT